MHQMRHWSVGQARRLARLYRLAARCLAPIRPLARRIRGRPLERPVAALERGIKGFLFDCRMCGQCVLGRTGLSCPMNCPKGLRNGPCGGVRPDGHCEVEPAMRCVWVEAWRGARRMGEIESLMAVLRPVDHSARGTSSWLRAAEEGEAAVLWHRGEGEA